MPSLNWEWDKNEYIDKALGYSVSHINKGDPSQWILRDQHDVILGNITISTLKLDHDLWGSSSNIDSKEWAEKLIAQYEWPREAVFNNSSYSYKHKDGNFIISHAFDSYRGYREWVFWKESQTQKNLYEPWDNFGKLSLSHHKGIEARLWASSKIWEYIQNNKEEEKPNISHKALQGVAKELNNLLGLKLKYITTRDRLILQIVEVISAMDEDLKLISPETLKIYNFLFREWQNKETTSGYTCPYFGNNFNIVDKVCIGCKLNSLCDELTSYLKLEDSEPYITNDSQYPKKEYCEAFGKEYDANHSECKNCVEDYRCKKLTLKRIFDSTSQYKIPTQKGSSIKQDLQFVLQTMRTVAYQNSKLKILQEENNKLLRELIGIWK